MDCIGAIFDPDRKSGAIALSDAMMGHGTHFARSRAAMRDGDVRSTELG